ncbi:MAG: hypothetical protein HRU19_30240 [Pseudobacteriovorax sp.]|nr:hypothetical protein [Pseudobacteriovorax sp.]
MILETEHFKLNEIRCPCENCDPVVNEEHLIRMQLLRYEFAKPIIVNSWHRCKEYNDKLPGSSDKSQHIAGNATDIRIWQFSKLDQFNLLELSFKHGFKGIGIYSGYLHLDSRSNPSYWIKP